MTTTPVVSSSSTPLASTRATVSAPAATPSAHAQDTLEMRAPVDASSACFCTSICSTIQSVLSSVKAKIFQMINYLFPSLRLGQPEFFTSTLRLIQDPQTSCYRKIFDFHAFFAMQNLHLSLYPSDRQLMDRCIQELFQALPRDLADALLHKTLQLTGSSPIAPENRIEISHAPVSRSRLGDALHFLCGLYPEMFGGNQLLITLDVNASSRAKANAIKALIDFDLNVRYSHFNLHSTMTEEVWKTYILDALDGLADHHVTEVLYANMGRLVPPRNGREAFLENPRSPEAKEALKQTIQILPH